MIVLLENIHTMAKDLYYKHGYTNVIRLNGALKTEDLLAQIHDASILGIRSGTPITKEILDACPKLLAIGCYCIGTNQVQLHHAARNGVPVFNDPHSNTRSVAELTILYCLLLLRDLINKNQAAHAGQWHKNAKGSHEIRGKVLGIVGYGRIGSQVSILAEAMGMQVYYYDIEEKLSLGNAKKLSSLEELLSIADIVSLHVPGTPATTNMINAASLRLIKKTTFLINTSRGSVVDAGALAVALQKKELAGAALDVFVKEPDNNFMPFLTPLQNLENCILTPHIAGATEEAQENIASAVTHKLINFIDRGSTEGAVNFPQIALPPNVDSHRILHIHENVPGMLFQVNKRFGERGINILAQYLQTSGEIGYVVFDINKNSAIHMIDELTQIKGTIRARILY